jgi:hypothetical protein
MPKKNRKEIYDYLLKNEPVLGKMVEAETLHWLTDIFQNATELEGELDFRSPRYLH